MATYLSTEIGGTANQTAIPVGYRPRAGVVGGRVKRFRASYTLASQATTDLLQLFNLPAGATLAYAIITSSVSLGSSTIALGTAATAGKYRAAATFTAVDTPTLVGTAATVGAADPALTAEETVIATIGAAALPASGTLVIDFYVSMPN